MKPFLQWLKKLLRPNDKPTSEESESHSAHWLKPEENSFGIELLDCRRVALGMISMTSDPKIAARFLELRSSRGEELRGMKPSHARTIACNLIYPHEGMPSDGPHYKAQKMEDKWDIYLYDGHLYFVRSWSGKLTYRAEVEFNGKMATVTTVDAIQQDENDELVVRTVDYLVKSHLYCLEVPHPLPTGAQKGVEWLAMYSFSQFGRRGLYGTFADTLGIGVQRSAPEQT
jgi:hypothetical protein